MINDTPRKLDIVLASIAKATLMPYYNGKYRRFQALLPNARQLETDRLLQLIEATRNSDFGKAHRFEKISSVEIFQDQVPIAEYSDLAPYLDAVANGHVGALFDPAEHVLAFACTAGSTGKPKVLPVTRKWLSEYQYLWQIWGFKAVLDHPGIMTAKWLQISGPADVQRTPSGHVVGMASAITARYQNPLFQKFYAVPYQIGDIIDSRSRNYAMLRLAVPQRVGFMLTITAANLIRFAELGNELKETLIKDLFDGTLTEVGESLQRPEAWITSAAQQRHPKRARELERIVERTGSLLPKDYWPLKLLACWTGGTVGYQARSLSAYYGDTPVRDIGYISTEGRHTIPAEDFSTAGVLVPNGAFYEFESPDGKAVHRASNLESGATYSILMTNGQGLYRYRIGDLVRCVGYKGQSPIIEFLRKSDQFSDMEGEKVSGDQVAAAMSASCDRLGLTGLAFSAVPMRPDKGAPFYAFVIEQKDAAQQAVELRLAELLDADLSNQNIMYAQKCADGSLAPVQLWIAAPGSFTAFAHAQGAERGTGDTQHKQPALLDARLANQLKIERTVERKVMARSA